MMDWVLAIPLLPALAFAALAPLSRAARNRAMWVSIAAMAGSLALSLVAFARVWPGGEEAEATYHASVTLATIGGARLGAGLLLDPRSAVMLIVVTLVGMCVQVYSIGYMHRDERIGWYYAVLSLFTAAMLAVVLADGFLLLYMAWEVMGLCSYLLIGFWHEQEAPRRASIKAFLTTRVGDIGFALALTLMFATTRSFDYSVVLPAASEWAPGVATAVALLLLVGAMGKSAQVPLHVWLPDAMAGPTPASALIHAATMVAAGVWLVFRATPIFDASGVALTVAMVVGITTALVGGCLALVQYDVKKVLAYSTISQLGYMFVALGAGGEVAGLFHLVTHAFFKSLLFLGAGAIIHATHTQDMREMGGLARRLPWTTVTFTVGSLALAGVFPLSGFFSKDEIITVLWHEGHYVVFALALLAALVTAFYVTRLWVRVFLGKPHGDAHEAQLPMVAPMGLLALVTAVVGFASPAFAGFLGHEGEWPDLTMALTSTAVGLTGIGLGLLVYARGAVDTDVLKTRLRWLYGALERKLYFDLANEYLLVRPFMRSADGLARLDMSVVDGVVNAAARAWVVVAGAGGVFDARGIDGAVNGVGTLVKSAGARARRLQTGRVQTYQRLVLGALVLLLVWVVVKGA